MSDPDPPFDLHAALRHFQRQYDALPDPAKLGIWQRARIEAGRFATDAMHLAATGAPLAVGLAPSVYAVHSHYRRNTDFLAEALLLSRDQALVLLTRQFDKLNIGVIWDVLWNICKQTALYVGGGAVAGAAFGAVLTIEVGGVGAIPGAEGGAEIGFWLLTVMGLADVLTFLPSVVDEMARCYRKGFGQAWSAGYCQPDDIARRQSLMFDSVQEFARGHLQLLIALLMGIVLYLSKGQGKGAGLFVKLRASKLGPKFADWAEANETKLLAEPNLQAPKAIPALLREEAEQKAALARRVAERQVPEGVAEAAPANVADKGVNESAGGGRHPVTSEPQWLQRIRAGNAFDDAQAVKYDYNEVYIDNAAGDGYSRLDSYDPNLGEIVSRKFTQLSDVQKRTAMGYINEIPAKYPVGATIADVPSSGILAGSTLQGQYILEVPVQVKPVPPTVLDTANNAGVLIRDVNGKIY